MKYTSTTKVTDERFPDVIVTLRKVSAGKRDEMRVAISKQLEDLSQIIDEAEAFRDGADDNTASATKIQTYNIKIASVTARIDQARMRILVKSVEGLEIDDEPATVESLIQSGDEELFEVVNMAIRHELGMDGEEQKNLQPPTTLPVVEDGRTTPTDAPVASEMVTI